MKKQLTLAAAVLLTASAPATAGPDGRTVVVLRARPVAIQPVYRPVISRPPIAAPYGGVYHRGYCNPALRVPVTYGHYVQRTHYVSPCLPNGYVGGLRNLPSSVIQIPPTFGRAGYGAPAGHGHGHGGGHAGR